MRREFIIDWLAENSHLSKEEIEKNMDMNYLSEGLLDSLKFLGLINECEEKFGISFSDDNFADDKIFTIRGLIEIVEHL